MPSAGCRRRSQVQPLLGDLLLVLLAGILGAVELGDLRDRHVPPGAGPAEAALGVDLDVDDGGVVGAGSVSERLLQLVGGRRGEHVGAVAGRVGGEVDVDPILGELAVLAAVVEPAGEALRSAGLRQGGDGAVAVVVDQQDRDLQTLLDGGHDLLAGQQEGAVADEAEDVAAGVGHLGADRPADLVAHAGVAVLQVVGLGIRRPPEPVQVARHRTGGVDHDVVVAGDGVHDPDRFGLGQAWGHSAPRRSGPPRRATGRRPSPPRTGRTSSTV